jgi:hypothetical protein
VYLLALHAMIKELVISVVLSIITVLTFGQKNNLYKPRRIDSTIKEQYVLLPLDKSLKEYKYLHKWNNPNNDQPTYRSDSGTIVTLILITSGYYARFIDSSGIVFIQHFEEGSDDVIPNFTLLADFKAARNEYMGKSFYINNGEKVKIIDVAMSDDNNAPVKVTYALKNGREGSLSCVVTGTNSSITDKSTLFTNQFHATRL